MSRTPGPSSFRSFLIFVVVLFGAAPLFWTGARVRGQAPAPASGQPSTQKGEWPYYNADLKGTRYSPLDQINGDNFNKLEVVWRFKTDNLGTFPEYKLEGTPLMVGGVL